MVIWFWIKHTSFVYGHLLHVEHVDCELLCKMISPIHTFSTRSVSKSNSYIPKSVRNFVLL
jgi:hypothetical protein